MATIKLTVTVDEEIYEKLKQEAARKGRSISNLANRILEMHFRKKERKP